MVVARQEAVTAKKRARCGLPQCGEWGELTGTLARAVAKKVRTPPPPRRVQAPQRRESRRPSAGPQRSPWIYAAAGALVAAAIAAAIVGLVVARGGGGATNKTAATNYNALPGIRRTMAQIGRAH